MTTEQSPLMMAAPPSTLAALDASKLRVTRNPKPAELPNPDNLQFGKNVTGMTSNQLGG